MKKGSARKILHRTSFRETAATQYCLIFGEYYIFRYSLSSVTQVEVAFGAEMSKKHKKHHKSEKSEKSSQEGKLKT